MLLFATLASTKLEFELSKAMVLRFYWHARVAKVFAHIRHIKPVFTEKKCHFILSFFWPTRNINGPLCKLKIKWTKVEGPWWNVTQGPLPEDLVDIWWRATKNIETFLKISWHLQPRKCCQTARDIGLEVPFEAQRTFIAVLNFIAK